MKNVCKILCLALAFVMVFSLAACNGGEEKHEQNATKYARVMLSTNVMSLDPDLATDGESFEVIAGCIDGLTQMDPDGAAIPALAEKYETSEDGKTWTFTLRDAKWSNGDAVTANDFVFAWQKACVKNEEYGYMFGDGVANIVNADAIMAGEKDKSELGVKAIDAKTLEVKLTAPVSFFDSLMYFPCFYPCNEKFYSGLEEGTYGTSKETYLSCGAYILEDYMPNTASMTLVKNKDYWNADAVKVEGIKYQVVGSSDNALTSFKAGELDLVTISGSQVEAVKADANLKDKLKVTGAGYMWYLSFAQSKSLDAEHAVEKYTDAALKNTNLRLAISNAIDRVSLVDNCVMDGSLATYTAVPPQFAASATTGKDFSEDQEKFKDVCSYNVTFAQECLAKAKTETGKETFELTMIYGNNEGDEVTKVAQSIKEQVEKNLPGVTINLQAMSKAERLDKMQNSDYDVALTRWGPDYADPMTYLGMWVNNNANNYGFWYNEEYTNIIKDCTIGQYVSDYDARWNALYQAETLVMNEAVIAPLYTKSNANLINSNFSGVDFHPVALNRVYKNATLG